MLSYTRTFALMVMVMVVAACATPVSPGSTGYLNRGANPAPATAQGGDAFRLYQDVLQY